MNEPSKNGLRFYPDGSIEKLGDSKTDLSDLRRDTPKTEISFVPREATTMDVWGTISAGSLKEEEGSFKTASIDARCDTEIDFLGVTVD